MASFPVAAFLHQTPSPGCPIRSRARPPPPYVVTAAGRPRHRSSSAPRALIQAKSRAWPSNEAGARPELGAKPPPHCGMPPRRAQHHSATPPWSRTGVPAAASFIAPRAMLVRDLPFSPLACVSDFPGHPSAGARAPRGCDARPRPTPCRRRALLRCHAQLSRCLFFFLSFFISFLLCKLRKGAQSLFHSGPACCSQPSAPHPGSPLPSRPAATKLAHWPQIQPSNPCFPSKIRISISRNS
jgi:hypothetical protein